MRWLLLSVVVVILDQISKLYASEYFASNPPLVITSWLNFILAHNEGAAFSMLGGQRLLLAGLSAVVSIVLIVWIIRLPKNSFWLPCSLALILGGAVGNLIDRVRFGYVVDFIDFHIGTWHFATFNIADAAISVGAVMMLIDAFFLSNDEEKESLIKE
ncbi:MAG: signal peptidase II [Gammaproteobacteria bacterium]